MAFFKEDLAAGWHEATEAIVGLFAVAMNWPQLYESKRIYSLPFLWFIKFLIFFMMQYALSSQTRGVVQYARPQLFRRGLTKTLFRPRLDVRRFPCDLGVSRCKEPDPFGHFSDGLA